MNSRLANKTLRNFKNGNWFFCPTCYAETWNMKKSSGFFKNLRKIGRLIIDSTKWLLHHCWELLITHLKNSCQRSWLWPAGLQSRRYIAKRCWGFLLQDVGLQSLRTKEVSWCRAFLPEIAYQKNFRSVLPQTKTDQPQTWALASLKQV